MRPLFLVAALMASWPCASAAAADRVAIVAAENFYGDLARQIGGTHVEVTSILSNPDEDPHLFEASPSTARALAEAAIVIQNGAGYDPWMDRLLSAAPRAERATIVAARLLGRQPGSNPHLWYHPATFPAVAEALAAELAARDPAHAASYRANLQRFRAAMAEIGATIEELKTAYAGTKVTATEPVFGYMAEALGLTMLNEDFQRAIMNDAEPSPSQIAAFEESLREGSARIFFFNAQVSDPATIRLREIAEEHGVAVIGVTETMPGGETIQSWFARQLDQVRKTLEARIQ